MPSSTASDQLPALEWTEDDAAAVTHLRGLAMDAVQRVGNGHPGTAMSLAPVAYLLFQKVMRHDPRDPSWLGRDRFVLSAGHTSLTLYMQLFLSDYGLTMTDLESFRTWGSRTPGHPEHGHTAGVETTTGPLGQGLANAVGMAMGARYERGLFDPDAADGQSVFDHRVWCIVGDGDMEEGITSEASSLAGLQKLNRLVVLYDDNHISIEGDTEVAFHEDITERYRAYGWATHAVDMNEDGSIDVAGVYAAVQAAAQERHRPTFIRVRSIIGWPSPHLQNTGKIHGSALGEPEVRATKEVLGLDPDAHFVFPEELLSRVRANLRHRVDSQRSAWDSAFADWRKSHPDNSALLDRLLAGDLPEGFEAAVPSFEAGGSISTRKASGEVINSIAGVMPELWGGSADLAESNNTTIEDAPSFLPVGNPAPNASPYGRVLHFGIREHAMGGILNGIALDRLTRPFGGTFLVFSDYMRGAVRLSALMDTAVTYVWTHDSIGLGEDGPTHQPVEHLWALRAIPNFTVVRPADANETAAAWRAVLHRRDPVGLVLTRQNLPVLSTDVDTVRSGVQRGAYVVSDSDQPQVLLLATGSEVSLALEAAAGLESEGIGTRVVSMPCLEWFDAQDQAYRDSVLLPSVRARVAVEAGATLGWHKYVGDDGRTIGLDHFGASAAYDVLFREFGITTESIIAAAHESITAAGRD
jgi:transketolase